MTLSSADSAALSLLDNDPFAPPQLTVVPTTASTTATKSATKSAQRPTPIARRVTVRTPAWQPAPPTKATAIAATVIASPALVQGLIHHSISMTTMLERWGLICLGCWAISEVVRRYVTAAAAARSAAPAAATTPATSPTTATTASPGADTDPALLLLGSAADPTVPGLGDPGVPEGPFPAAFSAEAS